MRTRLRCLAPFLLLPILIAFMCPGLHAQDHASIKAQIVKAGDAGTYPGSGTVLVFDKTKADVQDTGLTYVTQERLWKILTPSGGVSMRALTLDYDPQSAKVEIRVARIYRKNGKVDEIPLESVLDYPAPARAIYWGMRNVMIPVGRMEAGDALYVKSFRKGFTYALLAAEDEDDRYIPPMRGHFYEIVEFFSSIPIIEKSYTALVPADKPLQYEVYNGEVKSSIHLKDGKVEYTWSKKNIKPFKAESDQVANSDVATKLLMSTSPDWLAKSLWFHKVNEDYGSFAVTPEVKAKVDELLEGVDDDEEKVRILTHWVADEIRYSGITMGEGEGFTLHTGEMTFRDRCGVCKDKAGMLITMLRAAGFDSYPAMTMAGSRIDYIPADQFNHCVTLIKHGGILKDGAGYGDYRLLDPTWVPFMRELWSSAEQQQNYLPGTPEGADLKITQVSAPENHYFRIKGTSRLDAGGNLEGEFTLQAEGQSDAGVRHNLVRRRHKTMWHEYFDIVLHALSPRAELVKVDYPYPYDISDPIEITMHYKIPRYAVVAGNTMWFTPCAARYPFSDTHSFLHMNLDLDGRKYPFKIRTSRLVELSETVALPKGFKVSHTPEYAAVEGSAASFDGGYCGENGTLAFAARLELKKRIYESSDYANFCKAVKGLKHMMDGTVVLKRLVTEKP